MPEKSKVYTILEIAFLMAFIVEVLLVPYTLSFGVVDVVAESYNVEITMDAIWGLIIILRFTTSFKRN